MLSDKYSIQNRTIAVRKIMKLRDNNGNRNNLRKFRIPEVVSNAKTICKMVSLKIDAISEPPYTMHMTVEEVEAFIHRSH